MSYEDGNALERAFGKLRGIANGEALPLEPIEATAMLRHIGQLMIGLRPEPDVELIQHLTVQRMEAWIRAQRGWGTAAEGERK